MWGTGSAPSFADLDGDGDLDAIVGENFGNLLYFRNTGAGFELMVDVTAESEAPTLANAIADQSSPANAFWTFQVPANAFTPVGRRRAADLHGDARQRRSAARLAHLRRRHADVHRHAAAQLRRSDRSQGDGHRHGADSTSDNFLLNVARQQSAAA